MGPSPEKKCPKYASGFPYQFLDPLLDTTARYNWVLDLVTGLHCKFVAEIL